MIVYFLLVYFLIGLLFAVAFFVRGYRVIDDAATDAPVTVRLLWLPAAAALWPYLLPRWINTKKNEGSL